MTKSTVTFKQFFNENMTVDGALGGSPGGFSANSISGSDFYAPGDTRIPTGGIVLSRKGKVNKKRRRKRRKRSKRKKL